MGQSDWSRNRKPIEFWLLKTGIYTGLPASQFRACVLQYQHIAKQGKQMDVSGVLRNYAAVHNILLARGLGDGADIPTDFVGSSVCLDSTTGARGVY